MVEPRFAETTRTSNGLIGEVIHIDGFGNIITNLKDEELKFMNIGRKVHIELGDIDLKLQLYEAYADADSQQLHAIIGSHNFLEISINQGNA
ncbi:MAG: hypothetical protein GWO20_06470, partial [Candidatus Korarchaeota archaeon]|nr:hypothetical protein [Candidatus Korarchaeota archaeon]